MRLSQAFRYVYLPDTRLPKVASLSRQSLPAKARSLMKRAICPLLVADDADLVSVGVAGSARHVSSTMGMGSCVGAWGWLAQPCKHAIDSRAIRASGDDLFGRY